MPSRKPRRSKAKPSAAPGPRSAGSKNSSLERLARKFADEQQALLNRTVTQGITLGAQFERRSGLVFIGYGVNKSDLTPPRGIPLTTGAKVTAYLHVFHRLRMDEQDRYLTNEQGDVAVYLDAEMTRDVIRFEFERGKERYPEAHIQIKGGSTPMDQLLERRGSTKGLGQLHIPVGGKRFRPCIEDVIEFLIVEGLADGHPGWEAAVSEGREAFARIQAGAVARRYPEEVRAMLAQHDAEASREG